MARVIKASSSSNNFYYYFVGLIYFVLMTSAVDALQCYQCGQYNDGVGSITPCNNYSVNSAHLHLKDCPRKTDKFCIVSFFFVFFKLNFNWID